MFRGCRHSVDVFQPPSKAAAGNDAPETPADTTLPNIVRPTYNDLRSADDTAEADDNDTELEGSTIQSQVIVHSHVIISMATAM